MVKAMDSCRFSLQPYHGTTRQEASAKGLEISMVEVHGTGGLPTALVDKNISI